MWIHSCPCVFVRMFGGVGSHILRELPSLHVSWTGKQSRTIASRASASEKPLLPSAHHTGSHMLAGPCSGLLNGFRWQRAAIHPAVVWLARRWQVLFTCSKPDNGCVDTGQLRAVQNGETGELHHLKTREIHICVLIFGCVYLLVFESGVWKQSTPLENPNPKSIIPLHWNTLFPLIKQFRTALFC